MKQAKINHSKWTPSAKFGTGRPDEPQILEEESLKLQGVFSDSARASCHIANAITTLI